MVAEAILLLHHTLVPRTECMHLAPVAVHLQGGRGTIAPDVSLHEYFMKFQNVLFIN